MSKGALVRVRVIYRGRVQGVGFRASTVEVARPLPLTGWVQNEQDGSVLMEAQGEQAQIDLLRERIRLRMGRKIQAESAAMLPPSADEEGFEIRR